MVKFDAHRMHTLVLFLCFWSFYTLLAAHNYPLTTVTDPVLAALEQHAKQHLCKRDRHKLFKYPFPTFLRAFPLSDITLHSAIRLSNTLSSSHPIKPHKFDLPRVHELKKLCKNKTIPVAKLRCEMAKGALMLANYVHFNMGFDSTMPYQCRAPKLHTHISPADDFLDNNLNKFTITRSDKYQITTNLWHAVTHPEKPISGLILKQFFTEIGHCKSFNLDDDHAVALEQLKYTESFLRSFNLKKPDKYQLNYYTLAFLSTLHDPITDTYTTIAPNVGRLAGVLALHRQTAVLGHVLTNRYQLYTHIEPTKK